MTSVAAATASVLAALDDASDDDMSDGELFMWGADELGSDVEDDLDEDDNGGPSAAPATGEPHISGQNSEEELVREKWKKYMSDHKIKNQGTNPDSTHFAPWAPVGQVQDFRPRQAFQPKPGLKQRIRPERQNDNPVTELECFEKMFTKEMQDRIVDCTNAKAERIKNGDYPKPARAKMGKVLRFFCLNFRSLLVDSVLPVDY